jgi:Bacterial Ig-like domain (group 3)
VDLTTGGVGLVLGSAPNGNLTSAMRTFNSLADILAACVVGTKISCSTLLGLAPSFNGGAPATSLQAIVNIARYPGQNVAALFTLSAGLALYAPSLLLAPDAWTLAIRYNGNGHELDGPGNMAIDQFGNVWSTNNYEYNADPFTSVCGDDHVVKLTATGTDAPGAPYQGGGLYGAGFGITLDPQGNAWIGNFGFQGVGCGITSPNNSVSKFSGGGSPLSPAGTGFTQGMILEPQGTASDQHGNIWIANCGGNSVTEYLGGDPIQARNFSGLGLVKPFGLAIDAQGRVWIASNGNDSVVVLGQNGAPVAGSPVTGGGLRAPMGIAIDSLGNAWVANSHLINPPCPTVDINPSGAASITEITPDGRPANGSPFTGGGLTLPWGVAVDGSDNIWVANFSGQHLSELCGARAQCPVGTCTGMPISPAAGYTSDGLVRNTGVAVDPSGNVWLANNWLNVPVQTNPGGHEFVVFIGVATPIKTPLIGPPSPASGSAGFGAGCAAALAVAATTVTLTSSQNPSTSGQSVNFTATVGCASASPTGTVTFTVDGAAGSPATLSGSMATFTTATLAAGSHTVTATYSGDLNCAPAISMTLSQVVNAQPIEQPVGYGYCYPAANAPPPGAPCTPFTGSGAYQSPGQLSAQYCMAVWQTVTQQQACIAQALGNVGGFICPFGCGAAPKPSSGSSGQLPGAYCTMPDGARQWVPQGAPAPAGCT